MSNHTVISRIPETLLGSAEAQQMIPVVVVACVSMLAILGLTGRGLVLSFLRNNPSEPAREAIFFRTHLGVYIVCLVFANFLSAVTGVMEAIWIGESAIKEGKRCTTQATLVVFSDFLVAWFTAVVAVHTFMSLVLRFKTRALATSIVVGCGFVFAGLMAFIPPFVPPSDIGGPLYGNTTFICSIVRVYPTHQFLMHLLPMFLTAIVSTILYSLIFLVLRGTLVMRGGIRLQLGPKNRWSHRVGTDFEEYHQFFVDIAWSMLWYPLAYVTLVTPGTIILLLELSGFPVSWSSMVAATCFQQLLGLVNVVIIFNTIRVLRPVIAAALIRTGKASDTKLSDVESLGSPEYPNEKARTMYYSSNNSSSLRQLVLTQSRATSVTESINSQNSGSGASFSTPQQIESPITIPSPSRQNSLTGRYSPVARVATQVPIGGATPSARAAYIQQPIMTTAEMNAVFDEPIQPRADSPFSYHQRQYSNESSLSLGLPPPRRTGRRSPVQRSPSVERAPTPMFSPLTPPAPVQTFPSALRPESLYSLYQQRTPETARFQPSPTRFSRAIETSSDHRPSMTTFGVSRLP